MTGTRWRKLGLVFCPDGNFPWMLSHAANPIAEHMAGDRFRIYFSCRDGENRSSVGHVEIDINDPGRILGLSSAPVIAPGGAGLFDDSGASTGCLVRHGGARYLYYLGWNLGTTVPWRNSVGLAISEGPDGDFVKHTRAPVLDRSPEDPYSISYPWIIRESGKWRMWYGSNLSWGSRRSDMAHVIKHAESDDGVHWRRGDVVAVGFKAADEYAISRPCVVREAGLYRMWYSYRGERYRIGYAESHDGLEWTRMDERAGIDVSASGWDSEEVEYACVFIHRGAYYMLYNGNRYGKTGFGLAAASTD